MGTQNLFPLLLNFDNNSTLLLVFIALLLTFLWFNRKPEKAPLPPGPFRFPFVGSLSILPRFLSNVKRHQLNIDLARDYGRIFSFAFGKTNLVWLNDLETIKEAFITKGDIISDRTSDEISSVLGVSGEFEKYSGQGIGEANFTRAFKERKKLALQSMKEFGFGGASLEGRVVEETEFMIDALKDFANPPNGVVKKSTDAHQRLIHLAVSNVICSVVFGRRFDYEDASFVLAVDAIKFLFSKQRGKQIENIPFAKYIPAVQRLVAKEVEQAAHVLSFIDGQIEVHQESFDGNAEPKDFIDICLLKAELDSHLESEGSLNSAKSNGIEVGTENVKKIIADLFFAGTDTTATSVLWFVLCMMRYPEIQRRCHEEIDASVEDARNGGLTKDSINRFFPYTVAAMLESQRINSIANASLPHIVREDTTIGGYRVPKHSLVLANIRFLHFDERYWKDPELFDPSRWLDSSIAVPGDDFPGRKVLTHSHFIPYSVGKRRCLGENLAKAEYLIIGLSLLENFKFCVEDDLNPPSMEGQGLILAPKPFRMVIEQRQRMN